VNRLIPWFIDWKAKKTIRRLFADEIAERKKVRAAEPASSPSS
jgi:hypothetical protein